MTDGQQDGRWVPVEDRWDWVPLEQPPAPPGAHGEWHIVSDPSGGPSAWAWFPAALPPPPDAKTPLLKRQVTLVPRKPARPKDSAAVALAKVRRSAILAMIASTVFLVGTLLKSCAPADAPTGSEPGIVRSEPAHAESGPASRDGERRDRVGGRQTGGEGR